MKILLIDDTYFVSKTTCLLLQASGHEAKAVTTLLDGIKEYQLQPPDIVILDLNLKEIQGLPTLETFLSSFPDAIVVVYTGTVDEDITEKVMEAGAEDIILKGQVSQVMLDRVVRKAYSRHQKREGKM